MAGVFPSRSALLRGQLEQLQALLGAIRPANRFYDQKFVKANTPGTPGSLEEFSEWFPFTEKAELAEDQRRFPPYGSNLTFPMDQYNRYHHTSGTSGCPLRWLDTQQSWEWMLGNWQEIYRAASVRSPDRILFAFSFGPFIGFWLAFEAAARIGCLCLPGGGLSTFARLKLLVDNQATVLCCTPTYALRLAEVAAEEKLDLGSTGLRTIIVAGEPGGSIPATRSRLEGKWPGARIFDHHGMTEVGPVSFECPQRPGVLHIIEASYFPEIVDPSTGRMVSPGDRGELVLTTLGRTGSPLLRYRTGDLVKRPERVESGWEQACDCGRHDLALEGGILGRIDNMVIVRGVNVYPATVEEIVRGCEGIAEYQVQVSSRNGLAELELRVEANSTAHDPSGLAKKLQQSFQVALSLRVPVTVLPPGSLPRFEMKAERWVKT